MSPFGKANDAGTISPFVSMHLLKVLNSLFEHLAMVDTVGA